MSLTTHDVNFKIGEEKQRLPAFEPGSLLFTTDTNNLYLDLINKSERINIGSIKNSLTQGAILGNKDQNTIFNKEFQIIKAQQAPRLLDILQEVQIIYEGKENDTPKIINDFERTYSELYSPNGNITIKETGDRNLNVIASGSINSINFIFISPIQGVYQLKFQNNANNTSYLNSLNYVKIKNSDKNYNDTSEKIEIENILEFYTPGYFLIQSECNDTNNKTNQLSFQYDLSFAITENTMIIVDNNENYLIAPKTYTLETVESISPNDIYSLRISDKEYNFYGQITRVWSNLNQIEVENFMPIEEGKSYIWLPYRKDLKNYDTQTNKKYQLVGGTNAHAQGNNAFAFGDNVIADGDHSISIGSNTTAGHMANANGENVQALGEHSFGKGEQIFALGSYSIAFGKGNTNINQQISKEQFYETFWNTKNTLKPTAALDYMSFANGEEVLSLSQFSTTFGKQNKSLGEFSFTLGEGNETFGNHAVTFGKDNHNNGESSLVFGQNNFNAGLKNGLIYGNNNTIQSFSKYNKNNIATWEENYFYYYDMDENNQYIPITNSDFEKEEVYKPNNNAIGNFIIGNNNIVNVRSGETEENTLYFKNNIVLGTNNNIDDIQLLNNLILGNNILFKPNNIEISTPTTIKDSIIFGTKHYAPNSQVDNSFLGGTENQITDRENNNKEQSNIFAFGNNLIANQNNKFVIGQYNDDNIEDIAITRIFSVGNGDGENNRNNAFVVYNNGEAIVAEQGKNEKAVVQKQYVDNLPRVTEKGYTTIPWTINTITPNACLNDYKSIQTELKTNDARTILNKLREKIYNSSRQTIIENYVEPFTKNIEWWYKKWNDGSIECWCYNTIPFPVYANFITDSDKTYYNINDITVDSNTKPQMGVPAFGLPEGSINLVEAFIPLPFDIEWATPTISCNWNFTEWVQVHPHSNKGLAIRAFVNANSADAALGIPCYVDINKLVDENAKTPTSDSEILNTLDSVMYPGIQCYIHVKGYEPGRAPLK